MDTLTIPSVKRTKYTYHNSDGSKYCEVIRTDNPDGSKNCITLPAGLPGPHPLYRAERLTSLSADTPVYIVEGEKCVEALEAVGLPATTSKGGSKAANKTDWSLLVKFRQAYILPDNDEPGAGYARDVVDILSGMPGQREVIVCDLPGLAEGEDVADYLVDHDKTDLMAAIEKYGLQARPDVVEVNGWPEPRPVMKVLQVVPEVTREMLPASIGPWCFDAAHRMQCPVDFIAVAAITMMGSLIGRQLTVRPKARDYWSVKPNIWACLVGQPAAMKSPALKEARRFVDRLDREAGTAYVTATTEYERQKAVYEIKVDCLKKQARQEDNEVKRERLLAGMFDKPEQPTRLRYYSQDGTVERLQELLQENPRGLLLLRDELVGFLRGLDKPGQEGSRAFFLEAWEGDGRFHVDRIGRGSKMVDGLCIGVLGNATPGGMSDYVLDAMGTGEGADGLLQRFSLIAFPDITSRFDYVDRAPDSEAADMAESAFNRCDKIDIEKIGAECYEDSLPFLHFDNQAQKYFEEWYCDLVSYCRGDNEHPAIAAHLLKFSKMVPALSLIFHIADGEHGPIPGEQFLRSAAWADYAGAHARRLYESAFNDGAINGASVLLRHIQGGDLQDGFTTRDVYVLKSWTGLSRRDDAQAAIYELVEAGHLKRIIDRKEGIGGRPTERYLIHPMYKEANYE